MKHIKETEAALVKAGSCKQCGKPYTICPKCGCQWCSDYWISCPRCNGHESSQIRGHKTAEPALVSGQHTPTPYSLSGVPDDDCIMARVGMDRTVIARVPNLDIRSFIVKACNCHDELVKALQDCVGVLLTATGANRYPIGSATHTAIEQARAALNKASR